MRTSFALAAVVAVVGATCTTPPATTATATPSRGAELYARHCAVCHGADGDADTVVAELLLPRPSAFRHGLFKLVSTTNGMPTDDDLVQTLRRGMPGSTMMAWGWLPDDDLLALAREVRRLAIYGRAESIHATAMRTGRTLTIEQATEQAERQLQPGPTVAIGAAIELNAETLGEGERLYAQHCRSCHGADGRGLPQTRDWPTDGTWLWPRDFTSGYLRGEASHRELAFRIRAGMPGSHMPPTLLAPAETEALVAYCKSLIPDAAGDRHAQWRRTLRVARRDQLPAPGDDAGLTAIEPVRLPVAPLWWRAEACQEVELRAAHDGRDLVLRLDWADGSRDDRVRPGERLGDGIAVQFARDREPPLFAMGSRTQPVNVWRWHAYDQKEVAGMADLLGQSLHQGLDVPTSIQPQPRAESVEFGGIRSVGAQAGTGLPLQANARWEAGRWQVTFRRALAARNEHEVDLAAAGPVLFAIAVWDGSIDPHVGSKAITTWHVLELGR